MSSSPGLDSTPAQDAPTVVRSSGFGRLRRLSARHNTTFWLLVLLALLVVLNAAGVVVYAEAHPRQGLWSALWSYLESQTADLVFASLIFPLLIFLIEGRFNLIESLRNARDDRRTKEHDQRHADRLAAIEQTIAVWCRMLDWVSGVAYAQPGDDLSAALREGVTITISAEDAINGWARFDNLMQASGPGAAAAMEGHFLLLTNQLIYCTRSTIYYLRDEQDPEAREALQTSLLTIGNAIDFAVHHQVRNVLYSSLELMTIVDAHEDPAELRYLNTEREVLARRDAAYKSIDQSMASLAAWSGVVRGWIDRAGALPTAVGQEVERLRADLTADSDTIRRDYIAVPRAARLQAMRTPVTREWLLAFADDMGSCVFATALGAQRPAEPRAAEPRAAAGPAGGTQPAQ